jgi:Phospholipase_D-nuclease N-terminal
MRFLLWLAGIFAVSVLGFLALGIIFSLPWWGILSGLFVIGCVVLWIASLVDIWRRADLSTASAIIWTVAVLIFPLLGTMIYFFTRPASGEVLYRGETVT